MPGRTELRPSEPRVIGLEKKFAEDIPPAKASDVPGRVVLGEDICGPLLLL